MLQSANTPAEVDGRTTRWEAHKTERRRQLLDAAVAAIEADGPGVGVRQIAARAGVPRSVVYRHFTDRADLDEQISRRIIDQLMSRLAPTLQPHGTAIEAVRRVVGTYVDWIEQHPRLHAFLSTHTGGGAGGARVIAGTKAAIIAQAADLFATAAKRSGGDTSFAPSIAAGLVGLVDATINHWLADKRRTTTAAQLTDYLTRSIWLVLAGNAGVLGVTLDPDRPVEELLDS